MTKENVIDCDVAVIGSGMGGGLIARALAEKGRDVSVFERGYRLPREADNWDVSAVFVDKKYKNAELWWDRTGKSFLPGVHYFVGGNTKVYGASLARFRERDFEEYDTGDGISPAWPFSYADIEPYYLQAERALEVHGSPGLDPTEPWRSGPYPYPAVKHEGPIEQFAKKLEKQELHPYLMPMGVDARTGGACVLCKTCDGFPCRLGAKNDAETRGIDAALSLGAALYEGVRITRLDHDATGTKVVKAQAETDTGPLTIRANTFVLSAGAANSAVTLLNSSSDMYPNGLANSSGLVGRNWMVHNATFVIASRLGPRNTVSFQKTLGFNDWYLDSPTGQALGNVQMLGKIQAEMITAVYPFVPKFLAGYITDRSVDLYLESEDTPHPENRVYVDKQGRIRVDWTPTNLGAHKTLIRLTRKALVKAGYPLVLTKTMGIETNSHMCGTAVAGHDPTTSVVDEYCKTHDLDNLYIVDSSFFPSSAAMNPALTIAAQALRVADRGGI